jgi:phosphoglucomutase
MADKVNDNVLAWMQSNIEEKYKQEILDLLQNNENELVDSFYKKLEFGTGGMRGKMGVGTNRMNKITVGLATQGFANYLKQNFNNLREIKVVIAYDNRNNSKFFAQITADVFSANGIKVYLFDDMRPTPELSFAIRDLKAQGGVVITASHNPKEYNGYKVYWEDGAQVVAPHDKSIISEVEKINIDEIKFEAQKEKIQIIGDDIDSLYLAQLKSVSINPQIIEKNKDLKIVYTPLHGTGIKLMEKALKLFGFENIYLVEEQIVPDGDFPTVKSPNPENPEALELGIKKAKEVDADIILATDPDADRVALAVKNGVGEYKLFNGNQTGSILAQYVLSSLHQYGKIKEDDYIVKTIVTTDLIREIADHYNTKTYEVLTGFKYIAQIIREKAGAKFLGGFEESYGYLFNDFVRDKDSIMAGVLICEAAAWAKNQNKTLSDILNELYLNYGFYKESLVNIVREGKEGSNEIEKIIQELREDAPAIINNVNVIIIRDFLTGIESNLFNGTQKKMEYPQSNVLQFVLEDMTKITVRPSGTEPKIKYYFSVTNKISGIEEIPEVERKTEDLLKEYQKALGIGTD